MNSMKKAHELLEGWNGNKYLHGRNVLNHLGDFVKQYGSRALVVTTGTHLKELTESVIKLVEKSGVNVLGGQAVNGARPNAPREDVYRLESYILHLCPDCVVAIGGGSTIDACKAAIALATYGKEVSPEIDAYFGTGFVSKAEKQTGKQMIPLIAVPTSASSGSHLTKYSNITDPVSGQKKLIVDEAIVPRGAVFDYEYTKSMPVSVSVDGALDAIAHCFEVFCGANEDTYDLKKELAQTAIDLVFTYAGRVMKNPLDSEAREALGLATDLGGYAIMVGGTSGAHLTSFSLVDIVSHGTACGIMNPYYTVFYSPAIQSQLLDIGRVLTVHGFACQEIENLKGRELAEAVAQGFIAFQRSIQAPTTLKELKGYTEAHTKRILEAAKDPQLSMKLKNMPVSMTVEDVDTYMAPIIRAAVNGDVACIVNKENR